MSIIDQITQCRIVPVIVLEKAEWIVPLCRALEAGGLTAAEITFRTPAAREAIKIAAEAFPSFTLGAGTVTTLAEVEAAVAAGAKFAVAPGCNPRIVTAALEMGLAFFPGVATASEIEQGLDLGCEMLKVFPAGELGGPKMLKALYTPYKHRGVRFLPSGGIGVDNMLDYLRTPGVAAISGSWIVNGEWIKAGQWEKVTEATVAALAKAATA